MHPLYPLDTSDAYQRDTRDASWFHTLCQHAEYVSLVDIVDVKKSTHVEPLAESAGGYVEPLATRVPRA